MEKLRLKLREARMTQVFRPQKVLLHLALRSCRLRSPCVCAWQPPILEGQVGFFSLLPVEDKPRSSSSFFSGSWGLGMFQPSLASEETQNTDDTSQPGSNIGAPDGGPTSWFIPVGFPLSTTLFLRAPCSEEHPLHYHALLPPKAVLLTCI